MNFKKYTILLLVLLACFSFPGFICDDDDEEKATDYTISGRIVLPATVTNKCIGVVLDTDTDGGNGQVSLASNLMSGNAVDYSFINVPAGSYFVYAIVDMSCVNPSTDLDAPVDGDYFGFYPVGLDQPPSAPNITVPHVPASFNFNLGECTGGICN